MLRSDTKHVEFVVDLYNTCIRGLGTKMSVPYLEMLGETHS